jgi:hypothetical protein
MEAKCGIRLKIRNNIIIVILTCTVYFYYLAVIIYDRKVKISYYISEIYLFVVAINVGFLKRFAGL